MSAAPLSLPDLQALAEQTLGRIHGDGQVAVVYERRRGSGGEATDARALVTAVREGRVATVLSESLEEVHLGRAAKAASVRAGGLRAQPAPPLPGPAPGRPHDGYDPGILRWEPPADSGLEWESVLARVAVASSTGLRAAEQRTHLRVMARAGGQDGRSVAVSAAAASVRDLDFAGAAAEADALAAIGGSPAEPPAAGPVVLGPEAVAALLEHLRPHFGVHLDVGGSPLQDRRGRRIAASAVNLSDSPRHPRTLPRSYDAEGVPRQPVPLIQDGVLHGRVHDSASAERAGTASTGHATRPAALAPLPEHLVLVGGGAETIEELAAPVADGLYVPSLSSAREAVGEAFRHRTCGAVRIRAGRLAAPVADMPLVIDPFAVLASVEALGRRQRLVVLTGHCPGGDGAAVTPALRAGDGVRLG